MHEFGVIEKLKGLAFTSESAGVTEELRSAWKEWDIGLDDVAGDRVEHKKSAQLNLARMDFKRRPLYVLPARLRHAQVLNGSPREHQLDYFHVCFRSHPYPI